ncbi:hypothetical protein D3C80_1354830 [compost metagenome]
MRVRIRATVGLFLVPTFTYHLEPLLKKKPAWASAYRDKISPVLVGILKSAPKPNSSELSPMATKAKKGGSLVSSSPSLAEIMAARPSIMKSEGMESSTIAFMFSTVPLSKDVPSEAPAPIETGTPDLVVLSGPWNFCTWIPLGGAL